MNDEQLASLPEKVVQFGTGAFLRGFVEFFIDRANRTGDFDGRVVAIGSTGSGRDKRINEQHGQYTLAIRGMVNGEARSDTQQITALSRAVSAKNEWPAVLDCARDPNIELIFSNTTETGIRLDENDRNGDDAPSTFPGKLTAFLAERARHFDCAADAGVVIVPCELIENNGDTLRGIVLQLASIWNLDTRVQHWIANDVHFCNTLVDRIVPGELPEDDTVIECEPYRLFAIEARNGIRERLSFAKADDGVILCDDVAPYRERKVRLLNGTHTIMVPVAILAGCETVREAMTDEQVGAFTRKALFDELVASADVDGAKRFAEEVVDRFLNPYIRHALLDITLQQTMKMRVRVVPAVRDFVMKSGNAPSHIAIGFAAYLHLITGDIELKADEQADKIREMRRTTSNDEEFVRSVCADTALWNEDLTKLGNFVDAVSAAFGEIGANGVRSVL